AKTAPSRAKELGVKPENIIGVRGLADFEWALTGLQREKKTISRMEIESHGMSGVLLLGYDRVDRSSLVQFTGKFEDLFTAGAKVFFNGCRIAANTTDGGADLAQDGPAFLRQFAHVFLKKGGGRVGACTDVGDTWLGSNKVYHGKDACVY